MLVLARLLRRCPCNTAPRSWIPAAGEKRSQARQRALGTLSYASRAFEMIDDGLLQVAASAACADLAVKRNASLILADSAPG